MALIVEDGTYRPDAESYCTLAFATAYHAARGNTAWAAALDDTAREQALRRATNFMEQRYRMRWSQFRVTTTQALSWPRAWVQLPDAPYGYGSAAAYVPNNVVPAEVQQACALLALAALAEDLNPALTRTTTKETAGPVSVEYDKDAPEMKRYVAVEQLLGPYLKGNSSTAVLVRT